MSLLLNIKMKKFAFAASLAALAAAQNPIPIYGYYPGFVQGGNALGISVQLVYDPICEDSDAQNTVWN
jgi:hypothetical protein